MRKITLNEDDMRPDCEHNDLVTCGTCQRNWCDKCNPTPSARCPYEYQHVIEVVKPVGPLAPHGGCNWKGCRECFPHFNGIDEPNLEDMGNVRGYQVKYDPDTEEYQVEFNGLTLLLDYNDITGLSGLMHELDHDTTRRELGG